MNSAGLQSLERAHLHLHIDTQKHFKQHTTVKFTHIAWNKYLQPHHFLTCFSFYSVYICLFFFYLPDLAPFVMTEDPDNVDNADEDGGVFIVLSGRLLAHDSGDQPLCLFFGGPEFVWGPAE